MTLDDDVFELAKQHAARRSIALGKAVSELVRRGVRRKLPTKEVDGIVLFDLPPDSAAVTTELVKRLEAEEW